MTGKAKPKLKSKRQRNARKIYWDTCVFLAWIKNETCWPEAVTKGIAQSIEMAIAGQITIVTSTLTLAESLAAKLTKEQNLKFTVIFSAPYMQLVDVDRRISGKAATIRDHFDTRTYDPDGKITDGSFMGMGDAIQLATAIHFNVEEFQTLDGAGKRSRRLDLLNLDGNVAGARLKICLPKYIEPPVFHDGPISPVIGDQAALFDLSLQPIQETHVVVATWEELEAQAYARDPFRFRRCPEIPTHQARTKMS